MTILQFFLFWYFVLGLLPCILYVIWDYKKGIDIKIKDIAACLFAALFGPMFHIVMTIEEFEKQQYLNSKFWKKLKEFWNIKIC